MSYKENQIIKNLDIVCVGHYASRAGTLFIHSLLDNHPQILSMPGVQNYNEMVKKKINTPEEALRIFEKNIPKFYDTSTFTEKDYNNCCLFRLGENKKDKIITNKKLFETYFFEFFDYNKISKKNIILGIYYSYGKVHNFNFDNLKVLLLHPHEKGMTIMFKKIFNNAKFLISIRHPIKVYKSITINNHVMNKIRNITYYPSSQLLQLTLNLYNFNKNNLNMNLIKFENLKDNLSNEMRKICDFTGIKFHKSLLSCSFGGYKYWGNTVTVASDKFDENRDQNSIKLSKKDIVILNIINNKILTKFNYKKNKLSLAEKIFLPLIMLLPLDDELNFLKKFSLKNIKIYFKFITFFFPKRIFLMIFVLWDNFTIKEAIKK